MGNILLVDDDDDVRDAVEGFLRDQGHAVTTARNGLDALDALSGAELPDVAVIDVSMPEMDGLTLLQKMRGDPRLAGLPVIVMSACNLVRVPEGTPFLVKGCLREALPREIAQLHAPPCWRSLYEPGVPSPRDARGLEFPMAVEGDLAPPPSARVNP